MFDCQDIVGILSMRREFVVDRCPMGIAYRNSGRDCVQTLPNQLDEAQPLLGGKLEYLSNVSIAHDR